MGKSRIRQQLNIHPDVTREELWEHAGKLAAEQLSSEMGVDMSQRCRAAFDEAWDAVQAENNN